MSTGLFFSTFNYSRSEKQFLTRVKRATIFSIHQHQRKSAEATRRVCLQRTDQLSPAHRLQVHHQHLRRRAAHEAVREAVQRCQVALFHRHSSAMAGRRDQQVGEELVDLFSDGAAKVLWRNTED